MKPTRRATLLQKLLDTPSEKLTLTAYRMDRRFINGLIHRGCLVRQEDTLTASPKLNIEHAKAMLSVLREAEQFTKRTGFPASVEHRSSVWFCVTMPDGYTVQTSDLSSINI